MGTGACPANNLSHEGPAVKNDLNDIPGLSRSTEQNRIVFIGLWYSRGEAGEAVLEIRHAYRLNLPQR